MRGYCNEFGMKRATIYPEMIRSIRVNRDIIQENESRFNQMILNDEKCFCGSGKNHVDCCPTVKKGSIVSILLKKYAVLDAKIQKEKLSNNINFICKKGCNSCCSEYFYISRTEYFGIKNYLEKNNIDIKPLIDKSKELLEKLKTKSYDEYLKLNTKKINYSDEYFLDNEFISSFEPCIFLEQGLCSIYPVRPFICRFYGTSAYYNFCNKLQKKFKSYFSKEYNVSKIKQHTVSISYSEEYKVNVDYFIKKNNEAVIIRPYPLFWWFANDDEFKDIYVDSISLSVEKSIQKYKNM